MKLLLSLKQSKQALKNLVNIAKTTKQPDYLSFVLIEAKDGVITAKATNLQASTIELLTGEIEQEGSSLLESSFLAKIASLDIDLIDIFVDEVTLHAEAKAKKIKLIPKVLNPDLYPSITAENGDFVNVSLEDTQDLIKMINVCTPSISTEEARPKLTGLLFEADKYRENSLTLVSTDGHRLTRVFTDIKINFVSALVPRTSLSMLISFLAACESIEMGISKGNLILVDNKKRFLLIRLIDETFPEYRAIIPKRDNKLRIKFSEDIKDAFKTAAKFLTDDKAIHIKGDTKANRFKLEIDQAFEFSELLDSDEIDYKSSFKYDYLSLALDSTDLFFHDYSETTPLLCESDDAKITQIVMARRR